MTGPHPGIAPDRPEPSRFRPIRRLLFVLLLAGAAALLTAAPAPADVVPASVITLDVHVDDIAADLTLPAADLETASGIDIPTDATLTESTAQAISAYLTDHFAVTSGTSTWTVAVDDVAMTSAEQWGTGSFAAVTATATLTPPAGADLRSFTLDYDAIVHQVVTADVYVLLGSD